MVYVAVRVALLSATVLSSCVPAKKLTVPVSPIAVGEDTVAVNNSEIAPALFCGTTVSAVVVVALPTMKLVLAELEA